MQKNGKQRICGLHKVRMWDLQIPYVELLYTTKKGERMWKWLKRLFYRYFDYRITGHYFTHDKSGYLVKKYNRQYYLRKR